MVSWQRGKLYYNSGDCNLEILARIYRQPLGRIRLWILLLIVAWAVGRHYFRDKLWWRIGNVVGMAISVYGILLFTVLRRGTESLEPAMLIPFHSFVEAQSQPEKYREMLMNVFLFVPFGLTAPNVISRMKRLWPVVLTVVSALMLSVAIEFTQYYFHLGRCEVDDVIMNTLGATIGTVSWLIVRFGAVDRIVSWVKSVIR